MSEKNTNPLTENIGGGNDSQNRFEKVQVVSHDSQFYSLDLFLIDLKKKFDSGLIFGTEEDFVAKFYDEEVEPFHDSQFEWRGDAERYNQQFGSTYRNYKIYFRRGVNPRPFEEIISILKQGKRIVYFDFPITLLLQDKKIPILRYRNSSSDMERYSNFWDHSLEIIEMVRFGGKLFVQYQGAII